MTDKVTSPQVRWTLFMSMKTLVRLTGLTIFVALLLGTRPAGVVTTARAQDSTQPSAKASAAKATDFIGLTKCATCHFDQYKDWKTSAHGKAFDILPAKYRQDAECLKCHTTGYGQPSGYGGSGSNAGLAGISCEACHGPGGEHAKNALRLVEEGITDEALNRVRTSIQLLAVDQCASCHISKAHKPHPPFDRDESVSKATETNATRAKGFFGSSAHRQQRRP